NGPASLLSDGPAPMSRAARSGRYMREAPQGLRFDCEDLDACRVVVDVVAANKLGEPRDEFGRLVCRRGAAGAHRFDRHRLSRRTTSRAPGRSRSATGGRLDGHRLAGHLASAATDLALNLGVGVEISPGVDDLNVSETRSL